MIGISRGRSRQRPMPAWQRVGVGVVTGLLAGAATLVIGGHASADTAPASSSPTSSPPGTVAGVPATSSEVTVSGRGQFSNLKITVSQTRNIVNQAIGISWTGGAPTTTGFGDEFFTNFLQIMECWGNPVTDDSTLADKDNDVPANPGPPREQCEFGSGPDTGTINASHSGVSGVNNGFADSRTALFSASPTSELNDNVYSDNEVPFKSVDGTVVPHDQDASSSTNAWLNPYYDITTSNEIPFNYTWPDGTGSAVFQADTGLEASGLGCGQPVTNGSSTPRDCWLVIVPRGATDPLTGQPPPNQTLALGSPLDSVIWPDRIAIPLDFQLVSNSCSSTAVEHETEGSELVTGALTSWQSALCAASGSVIGYASLGDDLTREQITDASAGAGEMGFVSRPVDPSTVPAGEQLVYAPVTLSGVTISFVVDGVEGQQNQGPPVTQINLTPRLVAKLLTDSYQAAGNEGRLGGDTLPGQGTLVATGTPPASDYKWLSTNPEDLFADPDFQQVNPQLAGLHAGTPGAQAGYVMVELNGSDAAYELWSWILANPAAKAFLEGQPDPWGMTVDPYFSINPKVNPAGTGLSLPSTTYPNPDPWSGFLTGQSLPDQPPLTIADIDANVNSMADVAQNVSEDNTTAKTQWNESQGPTEVSSYSNPWSITPPGSRAIMGVTTTDSADKHGVINASLENAAGSFVAPDTAGLLAGEAAMQPSEVPGVLAPDLSSASPDAYPLSMLTYAAVPLGTVSKANCTAYAALLNYAAGPGQVSGDALGDLPPGYAPLPSQLTAQTKAAAAQVAACPQPPGAGSGAGTSSLPPGTSSAGSGAGGTTGPGVAAAAPGTPAGPGAIPAGGPAGISQSAQLTGGTTPANPGVFGYALPVGAATGLLAGLGAPLLSRRRQLLGALRLPALPHPARFPGGLPARRRWPAEGRPRRPWGHGRGSP